MTQWVLNHRQKVQNSESEYFLCLGQFLPGPRGVVTTCFVVTRVGTTCNAVLKFCFVVVGADTLLKILHYCPIAEI
jgi:chromate transport protein ChrA